MLQVEGRVEGDAPIERPQAVADGRSLARSLSVCPARGYWVHAALRAFGLVNGIKGGKDGVAHEASH